MNQYIVDRNQIKNTIHIRMKIISWNCNMAFRKKWRKIVAMKPDLLIIQECESKEKFIGKYAIPNTTNFLWFGDNPHKGIPIISFGKFSFQLSPDYNKEIKYVIPINVSFENCEFQLFAIWAAYHKSKIKGYVGRIWTALNFYLINRKDNSVLIGDFNSNSNWDKERKVGNHSAVTSKLNSHEIVSLYHHKKGENQGNETEPTLYLLKNPDRPYHIDYCYASRRMITQLTTIKIGEKEEWLKQSDHMPLIIENLNVNNMRL